MKELMVCAACGRLIDSPKLAKAAESAEETFDKVCVENGFDPADMDRSVRVYCGALVGCPCLHEEAEVAFGEDDPLDGIVLSHLYKVAPEWRKNVQSYVQVCEAAGRWADEVIRKESEKRGGSANNSFGG